VEGKYGERWFEAIVREVSEQNVKVEWQFDNSEAELPKEEIRSKSVPIVKMDRIIIIGDSRSRMCMELQIHKSIAKTAPNWIDANVPESDTSKGVQWRIHKLAGFSFTDIAKLIGKKGTVRKRCEKVTGCTIEYIEGHETTAYMVGTKEECDFATALIGLIPTCTRGEVDSVPPELEPICSRMEVPVAAVKGLIGECRSNLNQLEEETSTLTVWTPMPADFTESDVDNKVLVIFGTEDCREAMQKTVSAAVANPPPQWGGNDRGWDNNSNNNNNNSNKREWSSRNNWDRSSDSRNSGSSWWSKKEDWGGGSSNRREKKSWDSGKDSGWSSRGGWGNSKNNATGSSWGSQDDRGDQHEKQQKRQGAYAQSPPASSYAQSSFGERRPPPSQPPVPVQPQVPPPSQMQPQPPVQPQVPAPQIPQPLAAEPTDPLTVLQQIGVPSTIGQWAQVQDVVWQGHPPLKAGWLRVWSRSQNREYYVRASDMTSVFDISQVT